MRSTTDFIQVYQSMSALAAELGAVNLAQGIPEPVLDDEWRTAVRACLAESHFQYTPARGAPFLREAIARPHAPLTADDLVVTSGCTESLAAGLLGLARLGFESVVWLEPFYSYYPGLARIAGMKHEGVPLDLSGDRPHLDLDLLRDRLAAVGGRAVMLLNTPHNPSGLTLDDAAWSEVIRMVVEGGHYLLLDDVYRDFRYGPPAAPYERLLATGRAAVAGAMSKSYAATGVRLGWLAAPEELRGLAESAHMHLSNCSPDLLQRASAWLLDTVSGERRGEIVRLYRSKRDLLLSGLEEAGLRTLVPDGGHFVMARPTDTGAKASGLALELARTRGVVPMPLESFFSADGLPWLRFSFAVPMTQVTDACRRLAGR